MNAPLPRIIVAGALLAVFCLGTEFLRYRGGATKDISLPDIKLASFPEQLGLWKGEDTEVDDRLFRVIGADEVLSRRYTNSIGKEVTVHLSVYGDYFRGVPHPPTVCYPAAGWLQTEQKSVNLEVPGEPLAQTREVIYKKEGTQVLVMFWFQLGDKVFTDDQGLSDARRALRGRPTWPAIVKVLLQTPIGNLERDEQRLKEFGAQVYAWTSQLQKDETPAPPTDSSEAAPAGASEAK